MPMYTVDSEDVQVKATAIQATVGQIQAETSALLAQLSDLQSTWTGQAAVAFQTSADNWRAVQVQVDQSLASLGTALSAAGASYADAELSATAMFR